MANCKNLQQHTNDQYRQCLKNKRIVFMGDSTVRQYLAYIIHNVLELPVPNLKACRGTDGKFQNRTIFSNFNISVTYRRHAMPFYNPDCPPRGISSFPSEIDVISNWTTTGDTLVLFLSYHTHFEPSPTGQFKIRLRRTVGALKQLIKTKPDITIMFKGPHICLHDTFPCYPHISMVYKDIIVREFYDLRDHVIFLDV